jgi:hypothetical protein
MLWALMRIGNDVWRKGGQLQVTCSFERASTDWSHQEEPTAPHAGSSAEGAAGTLSGSFGPKQTMRCTEACPLRDSNVTTDIQYRHIATRQKSHHTVIARSQLLSRSSR